MPSAAGPGGLVIAGGAGRRMGGPKATLVLAGRSLVERAVDALLPHCTPVLVVSRPEIALPLLALEVVHDRPGPDTPLGALATGLGALTTEYVVALACDLPLAAPLVARVVRAEAGVPAVVAVDSEGRTQPLCARYHREEALAACERLLARGEHHLLALLDELDHVVIEAREGELTNLSHPADILGAEAALRRGRPPGAR